MLNIIAITLDKSDYDLNMINIIIINMDLVTDDIMTTLLFLCSCGSSYIQSQQVDAENDPLDHLQ